MFLSTSYIQGLRTEFIAEFSAAMPRFVLEVYGLTGPGLLAPIPATTFQHCRLFLPPIMRLYCKVTNTASINDDHHPPSSFLRSIFDVRAIVRIMVGIVH